MDTINCAIEAPSGAADRRTAKARPEDAFPDWPARKVTCQRTQRKASLPWLRGSTTINDTFSSRESNGGDAAGSMFVTGGAGKVTVTLTAPLLPIGWTIDSAFGAALEERDAESDPSATVHVGCTTSAPYTFDIVGLTSGKTYIVAAWLQLTNPGGAMAYGEARAMHCRRDLTKIGPSMGAEATASLRGRFCARRGVQGHCLLNVSQAARNPRFLMSAATERDDAGKSETDGAYLTRS